ncbi:MAG: GMC oxidoreductase [Methylococcales bacterium]
MGSLTVVTEAYVVRLEVHDKHGEALCKVGYGESLRTIAAKCVVLTASPIESARLVLASAFPSLKAKPVGKYLAEHIFVRGNGRMRVQSSGPQDRFVNIVVPPRAAAQGNNEYRYHVHILGAPDPTEPGLVNLRFTGEAAMDPQETNYVALDESVKDEHGVPRARIHLGYSRLDEARELSLNNFIRFVIVPKLDAKLDGDLQRLGKGRSHHECGTLRMMDVTDESGCLHGVPRVFVSDASVFRCVGVANPMLTVTAWAYRVADKIIENSDTLGFGDSRAH